MASTVTVETIISRIRRQCDWENEQVYHRNRLPARATFWPFDSVDAARVGDRDRSPVVQSRFLRRRSDSAPERSTWLPSSQWSPPATISSRRLIRAE